MSEEYELSEKEELDLVDRLEKEVNGPNNSNAEILLQYAKENFVYHKETAEYIEKKADDLVKYLALGTGLLGFLINFIPACEMVGTPGRLMRLGFLAWLIAFLVALATRYLAIYRYPENLASIYKTIETKGGDPKTVQTAMAFSYERARISHLFRGKKKACILKVAYGFLFLAVLLIVLSIVLIISSQAAR